MQFDHTTPAFSRRLAEVLLADLAAEFATEDAAPGTTPEVSASGTSGIPPECSWHHWAAWTVWACREVIRLTNHRDAISGCCNACIRETHPRSSAIHLAQVKPGGSAHAHDQPTAASKSDWNRWARRELSRFANTRDAKSGCPNP